MSLFMYVLGVMDMYISYWYGAIIHLWKCMCEQTDRQTDRETDRHTDRETDKQADRQTSVRQNYGQTTVVMVQ